VLSRLPRLQIEIAQPGDRGDFVIRTVDVTTSKEIYVNRLPEAISDTQYLYTSHLLERRRPQMSGVTDAATMIDDSWKKTDRYQDIVRYGKKLYADLFGTNSKIRNHVQRSKHLKDGVEYVLSLDHTASELWNIPWEYLHDGEEFIALRPNTTLVRSFTNSPYRKKFSELRQIPRPLRVLVMISDPEGVAPLDIDQEVENIMDALNPAVAAGLVVVDILEEGTLRNLDIALAEDDYHILHYTGHGAMTPRGSCLALENEQGEVSLAFIEDLLPLIANSNSLRLVILSGCQTGQIDETQAMSGIATGLLAAVPSVVAMQFSIADVSAQIFGRTFFHSIGQGQPLEDAMHRARVEMNKAFPAFTDWGVPTLYVNKLGMQLVDPANSSRLAPKTRKVDLSKLPSTKLFVGRRDEQRQLRSLIPNLRANMVYIWGMWGVGKSTLVNRVLQRPGRKDVIESTLLISCAETQPAQILELLATWLEPLFPQAAEALRHPQLKPEQRIQAAAQHVRRRRLVLVFDGFEAYQQPSADLHHWEVPNPLLENFMRSIAAAEWSIMTIFTSRYRWRYLNEQNDKFWLELHVDELRPYEVGMLARRFTHLRKMDLEALNRLAQQCGGHPATLHQLESSAAKDTKGVLAGEQMALRLSKWWHGKWFEAVINRLTPEEQKALRSICILEMPFWAGYVQVVANVKDRATAERMMSRWEACSLVHFLAAERSSERTWYQVHPLVRTYMLHNITPQQMRQLHKEAATLIEYDLVNLAEMRYEDLGRKAPSGLDTYSLAREELRIIMEHAPLDVRMIVIRRALSWRRHLLEIKDFERAASIVNDTWANIAYRFHDMELARELLEDTAATTKGRQKVLARTNIAAFLVREGKIDEAMKVYADSLIELKKAGDETNMAMVLQQQAGVLHSLGKLDQGLRVAEQALQTWVKLDDLSGQAESLRLIATLYSQKRDYNKAFKYVTMGETLSVREQDWGNLLSILNVKGTILKHMKQYENAYKCFQSAAGIAEKLGNVTEYGNALSEVGELLSIVNRPNDAAPLMLEAINIAEQTHDNRALSLRQFRMAMIYYQQRNGTEARAMAERALALAKTHAPSLVNDIKSLIGKLPRR
jgi:CHAT domain-containing protein/tetratricopeptide (TPR) repeat protein